MVAMFQPGGDELATGLAKTDELLIAQLVELLDHFKSSGALRSEIESDEAAILLFSAMVTQLFIYLSLHRLTADDLSSQVERQIDLAFIGLAPQKAT